MYLYGKNSVLERLNANPKIEIDTEISGFTNDNPTRDTNRINGSAFAKFFINILVLFLLFYCVTDLAK